MLGTRTKPLRGSGRPDSAGVSVGVGRELIRSGALRHGVAHNPAVAVFSGFNPEADAGALSTSYLEVFK
jgi:hypothetical protein